ncbi:uncharacterized protein LOC141912965 [Tubulanus polymorphus]|uniref:uncharacterized protein LOC141912965 n=1 Tax=Tubulanus polymorphus TaxID=672921 RepID=UPI003DA34F43
MRARVFKITGIMILTLLSVYVFLSWKSKLPDSFYVYKVEKLSQTSSSNMSVMVTLPMLAKPNQTVMADVPVVYHENVAMLLEQLQSTGTICPTTPKRIHQTWKTERIPKTFKKYVASWVRLHPDWEYWLWTDLIADEFVKKRFPAYYLMFFKYSKGIQRADAIRYFILYTFGGVYADLDIEALHPFNSLIAAHTAMIPEDHPAHSIIYFGRKRPSTLNALMISAPKHKYFRKIIEFLPKANKKTGKADVLWKTGPFMTDDILVSYEKAAGNEGNRTVSLCDAVYFASYTRFTPNFDDFNVSPVINSCRKPGPALSPRRKICQLLKRTKYKNKPLGTEAMSNHLFHHTYYNKAEYKIQFSIRDVVKNPYDIRNHIVDMVADEDFAAKLV